MSVEEELSRLSFKENTAVSIGVFDGVHLGHLSLFNKLLEVSRKEHLKSVALTFFPHPREVLAPDTKIPYLTAPVFKAKLLKEIGINSVITLLFDRQTASLSARDFAVMLRNYFKMHALIIGPDFTLGKDRLGDAPALRALGEELGFTLYVMPPFILNGEEISSTTIRKALSQGDIAKVHRLTRRYFRLDGYVITGEGRGASLGFPTANLDVAEGQALPADGVYAACAYLVGKPLAALVNIGKRPTFGKGERTTEVYIVDYCENIYGKELKVDIIEHLRPEICFNSTAELKKQIDIDLKKGKLILSNKGVI